jgi:hypothetical protein
VSQRKKIFRVFCDLTAFVWMVRECSSLQICDVEELEKQYLKESNQESLKRKNFSQPHKRCDQSELTLHSSGDVAMQAWCPYLHCNIFIPLL